MGKRSPVLLRHLDGDLGAAGEVPRRRVRDGVAGRLAEHLSVLAVTPLLAPRQVHGDRVEVREPAKVQICKKICGLGCVTRALVRA